jgi:glycosyltransferase involved in cell wall biosynthesis
VSEQPVISIIIAVLNGEKTLSRGIESVVNQTYPRKELIIMDGGSTDGTVELLKRYDSKITYWESKPDRGIYHAWNKALDHAEGKWICFIGADDFFIDEEVLGKAVPYLQQAERDGTHYVYGKVAIFSIESNKIISYANDPWLKMRKQIQRGKFLMHSGSFHHRRLFEKYGYFDESLKIAGDFDLIWRGVKSDMANYMDMVTICMGHGGLSMSLAVKERQLKEAIYVYRMNKIGLMPSALIAMLVKLKIYMMLRKIIGEKTAYRLGYYFSVLRGRYPIEYDKK